MITEDIISFSVIKDFAPKSKLGNPEKPAKKRSLKLPKLRWFLLLGTCLVAGHYLSQSPFFQKFSLSSLISRNQVNSNLPVVAASYPGFYSPFNQYSTQDSPTPPAKLPVTSENHFHPDIQEKLQTYLTRYHPYFAVYLVSDLKTGEVIAMGSRDSAGNVADLKYVLKSNYPAASLAKIVTSYCAIDAGYDGNSEIPQIGPYHTLFKSQLRVPPNYSGNTVNLKKAFAHSINPAFGILGQRLGTDKIFTCSARLGFNHRWNSVPLGTSKYPRPENGFPLAEISSGFTREITISPIHSLAIARAVGNARIVELPKISGLGDPQNPLNMTNTHNSEFTLTSHEQKILEELFLETVTQGTARKSFRRHLNPKAMEQLLVGGKTGSLNGTSPNGRYDWFIGFAKTKDNSHGIAISIMQVHHTIRTLRSPEIAALIVRDWMKTLTFQDS